MLDPLFFVSKTGIDNTYNLNFSLLEYTQQAIQRLMKKSLKFSKKGIDDTRNSKLSLVEWS